MGRCASPQTNIRKSLLCSGRRADACLLRTGGVAASQLSASEAAVCVVSFCAQLDGLLGGGFPTGQVTELCAPRRRSCEPIN